MKFKFAAKIFLLTALVSSLFCAAIFSEASSSKMKKIQELVQSAPVKKIKRYLIRNKGLAAEKYGPNQNSLLQEAMENGRDYDVIKLLLDAGVSPKAQNANGDSAVSFAAKTQVDKKILDALIAYDTVLPFQRRNRILRKNDEGMSAMDYAQKNANAEQMEVINHYLGIVDVAESPAPKAEQKQESPAQTEGPKPEVPAEEAPAEPETPAITAPEDADALLAAAAAAAARAANPYKRIYLFEGIEAFDTYEPETEKKPALIAEPNKQDANGRTLLHKAASQDDIEKILLLKDSGADFNLADSDGYTPLMYAARFAKKIETVALLLGNGANAKAKNRFGLTAIEIAADNNKSPQIVEALLAKSAKADSQKAYITAVGLGRPNAILQKFFDAGFSPNLIYKGKTALMYAAESNTHTDCIKLLLEKGADPAMLSSDWKDAFWYARQNPSLPKNDVYWSLNASEKK